MSYNPIQSDRGIVRPGIALAITLVVLVSLTVVTTILALRVAQVRQRQQYQMDYQKARYGVDSALKYVFAVLPETPAEYADRSDAADFSDLFWLDKPRYLEYLTAWSQTATEEQFEKYLKKPDEDPSEQSSDSIFSEYLAKMFGRADSLDDPNLPADANGYIEVDPNQIIVPGPYGPAWPNIVEPMEIEIGDCQVTITIEDENAKLPLNWLVTTNIEANKQARAALDTFAEWMLIEPETLENLTYQLNDLGQYKLFDLNPSPVLLTTQTPKPPTPPASASSRRSRSRRRATSQPAAAAEPNKQEVRPPAGHAADFAKLFHSSLLDVEPLSIPLPEMAFDDESPMKYLAVWGSQRVNVNTAPRHVLEAAFYFGGNPVDIADRIIRARREKPFKTVQDLRDKLSGDIAAMDRAAPYIDVKSNFLLVRITSRCGNAKVTAAAAVIKEDKKVERLIVLYGR